jgi:putative DNA primase/helicase
MNPLIYAFAEKAKQKFRVKNKEIGNVFKEIISKASYVNFYEKANIKPNDKGNYRPILDAEYQQMVIDELYLLQLPKETNLGFRFVGEVMYLYNGMFWQELSKYEFQKFLGEYSEKLSVPTAKANHYLFCERLNLQANLTFAYKEEISTTTCVLNFLNGILEIDITNVAPKINFKPHSKEMFLRYVLPYEYNEKANSKVFDDFLNSVLPNEFDAHKVLSEYMGLCFLANKKATKIEKYLVLLGWGRNGKGVFINTMRNLIGDKNISNVDIKTLTGDAGFELHRNTHQLLNIDEEYTGYTNLGKMKKLISHDTIPVRVKNKDSYDSVYNPMFLLASNNTTVTSIDRALTERTIAINFAQDFSEGSKNADGTFKQNKNLEQELSQELSGIMNWVIAGLLRFFENGKRFTECEYVKQSLLAYKEQGDSFYLFLERENIKLSTKENSNGQYKWSSELYKSYKEFCVQSGYPPKQENNFRKMATDKLSTCIQRGNNTIDGKVTTDYKIFFEYLPNQNEVTENKEPLPF